MAFKPSSKRQRTPDSEDINVLPVMNLVVVLIPLLLATAEWVKLGLIETKLPPSGGGAAGDATEQVEKKLLNLIVSVEDSGMAVSMFGATMANPEVEGTRYFHYITRGADGKYDYTALNQQMLDIRRNVVLPGKLDDQVQNTDRFGNPLANPDGTPQMVDDYIFRDADNVRISGANDMEFQTLVSVLDACREYVDSDNHREYLFPVPFLGKLN